MNYAAALGDGNALYFDDEREGGIIAPPMLAVALTWPITGNIWDFVEGDFPTHLLMTQVHYSEHLLFHQTLRPGIDLVVQGQVAAILPHRSGTHIVLRYDAQDRDGLLIFTEFIGGLLRGVECVDQGNGGENLPIVPAAPRRVAPLWQVPLWIDPLASYVYDGCTDLHFPIHTSPQFAHQVGLPGIVLQGTATLAHAARQIVDRAAGRDPQRLRALACRFGGLVIPGSEIIVRLLAEGRDEGGDHLFFEVLNTEGQRAIRRGYARLG